MHGLACSNQHVPVKHRSGLSRLIGSGSLAKFTAIQRARKNAHSAWRAPPSLHRAYRRYPGLGTVLSQPVGTIAARRPPFLVDSSNLRLVNALDRKSTRLNSSHANISYAVFCLYKKK